MPVDSGVSVLSRRSQFLPLPSRRVEPSLVVGGFVVSLAKGKESMPVSSYPARFERYLVEIGREIVIEPVDNPFHETILRRSLFPVVIDRAAFSIEGPEKESLAYRLMTAFDAEPLEDGVHHQAEQVIVEALQSVERSLILACLRTLSVDVEHPDLSASVLRCLGRLRPGTPAWRAEIVRSALDADDVEMRDAAVQAAESWGGAEMRDILRKHIEAISWLHAYIQDVIDDLEE